MTVASDVLDVTYNADGATVNFPIPFYFLRESDINVDLVAVDGAVSTLVRGTDFIVSGAGNPSGGVVTTSTAYSSGNKLHLYRIVPVTQETQYQQNDAFPAKTTEKALDKLTMIAQQVNSILAYGNPSLARALLLGRNDINGQGAYRANGNRISNLGDPVLQQDATNVRYVQKLAADIAAQIFQVQAANNLPTKKLADILEKAKNGLQISIACYGDSITYGQDDTASGVPGSQINGATQKRSTQQYPENMQQALALAGYAQPPIVYNRGFPGDSTVQGLTRWASASATDIAIIMYGHNDANNYGGNGVVPIAQYRINLSAIIAREVAKGAVVIVLGPPNVQDDNANETIRLYANAAQQLAVQYDCLFVDMAEVLGTVTKQFVDGIHLTSFAYAEMGWQLSGMFLKRNGQMQRVGAGEIYYPDDALGHCPAGEVINWEGGRGNNRLIRLQPGATYSVGIECLDDVYPVIHSICVGGTNGLTFYYAGGGGSPDKGVPSAALVHDAAYGLRQSFTGTELRKGRRSFFIRNDTSSFSYIEAIEFVGKDHLHTSRGNLFKSTALTGAFQPRRIGSSQPNWWAAADLSRKLKAPYGIVSRLTLTDPAPNGLAVWQSPPTNPGDLLGVVALFVLRNGTDLIIREYTNGSASDTVINSVFASGEWTGELEIAVDVGGISAYVNGALAGTKAAPTLTSGYAGLLADHAASLRCLGLYVNGHVKGPY
ncbi:phage tail fiber domain-containing protein [Burkholderia cenocepacia]|uniref:phage tail fiber domain-containing protein n=1 Tax=Burkholderia cenocepacia TaxID=95486 RepID=UPI000D0C20E9|nr:phage tail fiber protein [Burkholderia cenocepacia]SOT39779.1 hypothetical protein F01_230123 [Burkholderia cenocepacia]